MLKQVTGQHRKFIQILLNSARYKLYKDIHIDRVFLKLRVLFD
jgi:hypothetical protein